MLRSHSYCIKLLIKIDLGSLYTASHSNLFHVVNVPILTKSSKASLRMWIQCKVNFITWHEHYWCFVEHNFFCSSSGLNGTDDRTSKSVKKHADPSDKQSKLNDYCYSCLPLNVSYLHLHVGYMSVFCGCCKQQSHNNKKNLVYLKEACKIKQLIKMLSNMHENCVWCRPAESNLLSSNWTEKRHQQDHRKIAQNCESNLPPQRQLLLFIVR